RVRFRDIEIRQKGVHMCPSCGAPKLKRLNTSIWQCRKCSAKFAGGAYVPKTDAALGAEKQIQGVIEKLKATETGGEA
ncbi:MAG TPA: hypothetical protein VI818_02505, partial [Candidatus Thermoplasmatota archaeon]|nr:hypothetical protein [Candidatus Thermoplasmatota archaeon]